MYLALFDEVIIPSVERFRATWILVSAGFDAHRDDPLANMRLTAGDFADLTARVASLAGRPGRLALFLEGGYDLPALRASVAACAARLVGASYRPEPASSGGSGPDPGGHLPDAVARRSGRAAVTAHPGDQPDLAGVDGSDNSRRALVWAILLAQRFQAELVAVHAVGLLSDLGEGPPVPSQSHLDELRLKFERDWCAPLRASAVPHRLLLRDGPPVPVLVGTADDESADLIVVGSRGVGGFPELLLGSTSHHVVERANRPVLVVPPAARP